jgi:glutathione synthase/RimK-type ligase-like ATP-grasp enzyme
MPRRSLVVVDDPLSWPLDLAGVEIVAARAYLTEARFIAMRGVHIFNLCRSYRYQSLGYYVSLLAAARGHKPQPSVAALQDLKSQSIIRLVSEELDALIQRSLKPLRSAEFVLSIYFGHNLAKRYDRLCLRLFKQFQAPLLRARFVLSSKDGHWSLHSVAPIASGSLPEEHRAFAEEMARDFFQGRRQRLSRKPSSRFDLAILTNPTAVDTPSNPQALKKFGRAAEKVGFDVELIERDDIGRLAEFDALLIRETTNVNHYTYRFARRAAAEGLVVIDDPESILLCTNKVFLAELLERNEIPAPRSMVVHRGNLKQVLPALGLPCIVKLPDSSFSQGVLKVSSEGEFQEVTGWMLQKSEMLIAQEFMPTEFDWRIGVFNRRPLFACRYYMVKKHWQILKRDARGKLEEGRFDCLPLAEAPKSVVSAALRAANLIGDGLYGVDLKQIGRKVYVIEVNDNPNIDGGVEDQVLKEQLYMTIMEELMRRVEAKKGARK